jgi:hypothetical protein
VCNSQPTLASSNYFNQSSSMSSPQLEAPPEVPCPGPLPLNNGASAVLHGAKYPTCTRSPIQASNRQTGEFMNTFHLFSSLLTGPPTDAADGNSSHSDHDALATRHLQNPRKPLLFERFTHCLPATQNTLTLTLFLCLEQPLAVSANQHSLFFLTLIAPVVRGSHWPISGHCSCVAEDVTIL